MIFYWWNYFIIRRPTRALCMVSTLPSYTVTVEFLDNFIVKETDKLIYLVDYISCDLISNQTRIRTAIQIRRKAKM